MLEVPELKTPPVYLEQRMLWHEYLPAVQSQF